MNSKLYKIYKRKQLFLNSSNLKHNDSFLLIKFLNFRDLKNLLSFCSKLKKVYVFQFFSKNINFQFTYLNHFFFQNCILVSFGDWENLINFLINYNKLKYNFSLIHFEKKYYNLNYFFKKLNLLNLNHINLKKKEIVKLNSLFLLYHNLYKILINFSFLLKYYANIKSINTEKKI